MAARQQAMYGIVTDVADLSALSRSENEMSSIKIFALSPHPLSLSLPLSSPLPLLFLLLPLSSFPLSQSSITAPNYLSICNKRFPNAPICLKLMKARAREMEFSSYVFNRYPSLRSARNCFDSRNLGFPSVNRTVQVVSRHL